MVCRPCVALQGVDCGVPDRRPLILCLCCVPLCFHSLSAAFFFFALLAAADSQIVALETPPYKTFYRDATFVPHVDLDNMAEQYTVFSGV